jgi:hypothetical protein
MLLVPYLLDDTGETEYVLTEEMENNQTTQTFELVFTMTKTNISSEKFVFDKYFIVADSASNYKIGAIITFHALTVNTWKWRISIYDYNSTTYRYQSSWKSEYINDFKFARITFTPIIGYPYYSGGLFHYKYSVHALVFDEEFALTKDADSNPCYNGAEWTTAAVPVTKAVTIRRFDQTASGDKASILFGPLDSYSIALNPWGMFTFNKPTYSVNLLMDGIKYSPNQVFALDYRTEIDTLQSELDSANAALATAQGDIETLQSTIDDLNNLSTDDVSGLDWDSLVNDVIRGGTSTLDTLKSGFLDNSVFGLAKILTAVNDLADVVNQLKSLLIDGSSDLIDNLGEVIMSRIETKVLTDEWLQRLFLLQKTIVGKVSVEPYSDVA